ncbi:SusC/RagA family TonB-linked outer membrane protein [Segetibacter koreensis]|uniref:SusC/RagA family TonB-linked outer membrane protein n=1 Tax=Segetibacter koreensis TaxID=398037 RepID=UPI0003620FE6|nr:SusC/RagA family TonB-linked outer membrane protein [Segetibacter koreensis]
MTKKLLFLPLLILLLFSTYTFAQNIVISGKVKDQNGNPVSGATVSVKGSRQGAATNESGNFSINVKKGAELTISYVGFVSQNIVANSSPLNVTLQNSSNTLNEVVVTALGVERNRRSLQSSITTVGGENLTQAREVNLSNALAGRVAGVNVSKVASGPGGSSRVVIRGAKTLGSTLNQPLYVVDGVPIDNTNLGQAGVWGGSDQGDAMNSINPDDIASMTVLKGASAAALYGSRAANGVILITTKKGSARKGLGVEYNGNYVAETVQNLTDFQTTHGDGGYVGTTLQNQVAKKAETLDEHWQNGWGANGWGPKFDGSSVVQFDGISRPYSYAGDNWKRFYKTGNQITNTVAITGGSETQSFRLSLSDLTSTGVFPNSGFDRFNATLSANSKIGKRITMNAKVLYSNEKNKNRPRVSDAPGNANLSLYYTPGDVDVRNLIGDPGKPGAVPSIEKQQDMGITIADKKAPGEEFAVNNNIYQQNPYWAAYQFKNNDTRDRVITNGDVRYNITDFLYMQGQAGMDFYTLKNTRLEPQGTGYDRPGAMNEIDTRVREINLQYMLGFNKTFNRFGVNAFVGGNRMRRMYEQLSLNGSQFNTPFLAAISNAKQHDYSYGYNQRGINSLFGSVELSYNNYLFLTGTARRDWFSVLNPQKNGITYPSIGGSFVFTDAFKTLPKWLSFGKLRASWAQVGNTESVQPYRTAITYGATQTHLGIPLGGFTAGNNLPNPYLVPFTSTEMEYGLEFRVFQNRLGLDITYYDQKTTNDILDATISQSSGFGTTSVNLGKLTNKGVEFLLTATPVKSALTWDVSLNFAKNNSKVVSLIEGQNQLFVEEPRTRTAAVYHIVGYPYGMIEGVTQMRDPNGNLVYDSSGTPLTDNTYKILGNGVPDFTGGLNNSLTWKGVNLSFLIDFRSGGDIYSGTNVRMTEAGFTKQSLLGRAGEAPLTITGVTQDVAGFKPFTKTLTPGEAANYWSQLGERAQENFMYDASFIKLRQITLGYTLPSKLFTNTPIRSVMVSFVARNLAILYKNVPNIDPEATYTSSNAQGLDYFGMPATRTYGFNIRASF